MHRWLRLAVSVLAGVALLDLGVSAAAGDPSASVHVGPNSSLTTLHRDPAPATISAGTSGQNFVTVTPCRLIDTRNASAGRLSRDTPRSFVVGGSTGFPAQGGHPGGCGIPSAATGVAVAMTTTQPDANGILRAWRYGASEPIATLLGFSRLTGGATTGAVLPLTASRSAGAPGLTVVVHGATTHLVVDVTGYYAPQLQAFVSDQGTLLNGTVRATSATRVQAGNYLVSFDQDLTGCSPHVTVAGEVAAGQPLFGDAYLRSDHPTQVYVETWDAANADTDAYFYVSVVC
jgi:hypothetical protein